MAGQTDTEQNQDEYYLAEKTIRKIIPVLMAANFSLPQGLQLFLSSLEQEETFTARDGGYGCDDPFAIFGFLAFLLALLQLLVDSGGEERRKRSANKCREDHLIRATPEIREGVLGAAIMFQGLLNSMDTASSICEEYVVCEAAQESARLGVVGGIIGRVGSTNIGGWLGGGKGVTKAGNLGVMGGDCAAIFPCDETPPHYKFPPHMEYTDNNVDTFIHLLNISNDK